MPTRTVRANGKDVEVGEFDRMDFLPYHEGPNVLPHDLLFHTLHALATADRRLAVVDCKAGYQATYQQLLSDIVLCRNKLRETLDKGSLEALRNEKEVSLVLWSSGYEFTVAFFAVLALGAIAVPLSPHITLPEAHHYCKTVDAHGILTASKYIPMAQKLHAEFLEGLPFKILNTTPHLGSPLMDMKNVIFQSGRVYDQNKPSLVIFTSGSTGPPKGVGIRRYNLFYNAYVTVRNQQLDIHTRTVQFLPTHHATGLLFNTMPTLMAGGCIEIDQGNFDPSGVWERIRRGDVKTFSAVPTIYVRLLNYWDSVLSKQGDRDIYRSALSKINYFACSTSALPRKTFDQWVDLAGKPISERYGGSEFGNVYVNPPGGTIVPGSVGIKNPATESKLSGEDHGEVLVRGPMLFAKYMNDPIATIESFNPDGFYRTGDIARQEDDVFFIEGRVSIDIIKSGGYKISALDIEKELNSHPKVAEGIIVGVPDEEFGQRVAAAVVLRDPTDTLTLTQLREDLRASVSNYKLPTLLRVVPEFKKTSTMKIPKALIKDELFGNGHPDIQKWGKPESQTRSKL